MAVIASSMKDDAEKGGGTAKAKAQAPFVKELLKEDVVWEGYTDTEDFRAPLDDSEEAHGETGSTESRKPWWTARSQGPEVCWDSDRIQDGGKRRGVPSDKRDVIKRQQWGKQHLGQW